MPDATFDKVTADDEETGAEHCRHAGWPAARFGIDPSALARA
jgi:hypothetical protein